MIKKLEYVSKCVFQEQRVTVTVMQTILIDKNEIDIIQIFKKINMDMNLKNTSKNIEIREK